MNDPFGKIRLLGHNPIPYAPWLTPDLVRWELAIQSALDDAEGQLQRSAVIATGVVILPSPITSRECTAHISREFLYG